MDREHQFDQFGALDGRNHQGTNQSEEMNASEQDSIEAGATADPETVQGAEAPGGEPDAGQADKESGRPGGDLNAQLAEEETGDDPVQEEAAELRSERDLIRDRHLRLAADFDNYRKRTEDRLRLRWDRAQADLISRLLEPLDDLLRVTALEPGNASVEAIVEGVDLVERKFFRVIEDAGVEVVDPVGEPFDPNTMEAMMSVPAGSEDEDDLVERVFQRGYTFRGQLVRPARVSVFKA